MAERQLALAVIGSPGAADQALERLASGRPVQEEQVVHGLGILDLGPHEGAARLGPLERVIERFLRLARRGGQPAQQVAVFGEVLAPQIGGLARHPA